MQRQSWQGTLVDHQVAALIRDGHITNCIATTGPNSLDVHTDDEAYEIPGLGLPKIGQSVHSMIKEMNGKKINFGRDIIRRHKYYAIKVREGARLPLPLYSAASTKSSIGRIDCHVPILCDGVPFFDTIPKNHQGELWVMVNSQSFHLHIPAGTPLTQLRFMVSDSRLDCAHLKLACLQESFLRRNGQRLTSPEVEKIIDWEDRSLMLGLGSVTPDVLGFRAKNTEEVLDLSQTGTHNPDTFFELIERNTRDPNERLLFEHGRFYIAISQEALCVPPNYACVLQAVKIRHGEQRVHYAGYADGGFGYGPNGERLGRRLVYEIRPRGNIYLALGQPVASAVYERTYANPFMHYDEIATSNYTNHAEERQQDNPYSVLAKFFDRQMAA